MYAFVLALYIGYALFEVFPYTDSLAAMGSTLTMHVLIQVAVYAVAVAISFVFARKVIGRAGPTKLGPRLILGLLVALLLLALAYHPFGINHLFVFPSFIANLFAPAQYFFWWFVLPLVGLFLLTR